MTDEEMLAAAVAAKLTGEKFYVGQRVVFRYADEMHTGVVLGVMAFLVSIVTDRPLPEGGYRVTMIEDFVWPL